MNVVLMFISYYDELHGIVFLLKPNDARPETSFKYCIKKLLKNLHRSAVANLLFIFTNTHSTFYEPGDTLPVLKTLLRELQTQPPYVEIPTTNNTVCVDTESFRYLAARSFGVQFKEAMDEDFQRSWEKSSATARRIVYQIKTLTPQCVRQTTTLNEVRQKILLLAEPVAQVGKNIESRKHVIEHEKQVISEHNGTVEDLRKHLKVEVPVLTSFALTEPATVCANPKCCSTSETNGQHQTIYHSSHALTF